MPNVSLFITCLNDLFLPQVGTAVVDVLEHYGCRVDFPEDQTCCGQPQFNNGFRDEARTLAARMIRVFESSQYVVTPSSSCCAMVREHYPHLFGGDDPLAVAARKMADKTYEFSEFLTQVLKADLSGLSLPSPTSCTCHFSCHQRGLGQTSAAMVEGLMRQIGNLQVLPLEKAEQCCGFGGAFSTKYPQISGAMVQDKISKAQLSGAQILVVNDAGCSMNIGGACHRHNMPFAVRHIAQLIAEAIHHTAPSEVKGGGS